MNKVVEILMIRDGMSRAEAEDVLSYCREMINNAVACGDYEEAEDIVASELGLEMDYIFDII